MAVQVDHEQIEAFVSALFCKGGWPDGAHFSARGFKENDANAKTEIRTVKLNGNLDKALGNAEPTHKPRTGN